MTDAAPQQFEWKNGDRVCSGDICGVFIGFYPDDHDLCYVIEDNIANPVLFHTNHLSRPKTPEQRAERERDEMAKQIMIDILGEGVFDNRDWEYHKKFSESAKKAFKLIDLGYRKQ